MNSQTKEPFIQVNKGESAVTANITFRTEQFADEAIQKYNGLFLLSMSNIFKSLSLF